MQKNESIRDSLKKLPENTRFEFKATFKRFGYDRRFPNKETALLINVYKINKDKNLKITDHNWVLKSKRWTKVSKSLKEGDKISFTAEITPYYKEGKNEYFIDYGLKSIRSVEIINDN